MEFHTNIYAFGDILQSWACKNTLCFHAGFYAVVLQFGFWLRIVGGVRGCVLLALCYTAIREASNYYRALRRVFSFSGSHWAIMKTLATRKGLLLLVANAAIVIPTHLISSTSAFTSPAPHLHLPSTEPLRAGLQGTTTAIKRRCKSHRSSAISMSSDRKRPAAIDVPIRSTLHRCLPLRSSRRSDVDKKRATRSRRLAGEGEQDPVGIPPTAPAASGVGGGVPTEGLGVMADRVSDAAEPPKDEAGPTSSFSIIGALRQLGRVQKQVREVPEDAADEGRFLVMAAIVGILTGSAGGSRNACVTWSMLCKRLQCSRI